MGAHAHKHMHTYVLDSNTDWSRLLMVLCIASPQSFAERKDIRQHAPEWMPRTASKMPPTGMAGKRHIGRGDHRIRLYGQMLWR